MDATDAARAAGVAVGVGGCESQPPPLPAPAWRPAAPAPLHLASVEAYEELALTIELTVQQLLPDHTYNTVGNFIRFYREYQRSGEWELKGFFREYKPVISPAHHTCVGLGLELVERLKKLEGRWAGLVEGLHLVSCEEAIEDVDEYTGGGHPSLVPCEKEHVLVCLRFSIAGRTGLLLLDPGYHVARVVTVMKDQLYPHTGWFMQMEEGSVRKEYKYSFCPTNEGYVVWEVAETRGRSQNTCMSLIYVGSSFQSAVDVTERRNLVYDFRSWLARDTKGRVTAGVYFGVPQLDSPGDEPKFTLLYTDPHTSVKHRLKLSFSSFVNQIEVKGSLGAVVDLCGTQLGLAVGRLTPVLATLASILSDSSFIKQLHAINQEILNMPS